MRGRIFGIKKTTILKCSFILFWLLSFAGIALSIWLFHDEKLWFFFFALFQGLYLALKGSFFNLDSALYFGLSLVFVGISGIIVTFVQDVQPFAFSFYFFSFALASFFIGIKFKQKYQIILAFLLFLVMTLLLFVFPFVFVALLYFRFLKKFDLLFPRLHSFLFRL